MQPPNQAAQQAHVFIAEAKEAVGTGNLAALQHYATEGTKEDLVTYWTRCVANNDSVTATAVIKLLSAMLMKCDGEPGWSVLGTTCIRRILAEHTKAIFRNVSSGKAVYVNPTLRLLITMTTFDVGSLANEVYAAMDIPTFKGWPKLLIRAGPPRKENKVSLGKRKREEHTSSKDAVRGLFVELFFTLVQQVQPTTKADLLSHRQLTTELFKHIIHDDAYTLSRALKGMTHIVETHDIPRTAKVKFFNEWSLERLVGLYNREFQQEEEDDTAAANEQLRNTLHTFFLRATTIANEGLCFAAHGLHPPPGYPKTKLYNPILGAFCLTLKPLVDDLQRDLLLKMLTATPELVAHYVNHCTLDFEPQLEVSWIGAMGLLEAILGKPLPDEEDEAAVIDLPAIPAKIKADTILPVNLSRILVKGLHHASDLVKLMTAKTFWSAMKKLQLSHAAGSGDETVLELIQSRCPELQIVLKPALQVITAETSEEVGLLREVCVLLLSAYVALFEDLPGFDFASLFSLILSQSKGTLVTNQERDAVMGMVSNIRGLPWLQRKKDAESVFSVLLKRVLSLSSSEDAERRATGVQVLDTLTQEDSFMLSATPVSKSEALLRSLQSFDLAAQAQLVAFIEECFIRFQATPYRYYDQLIAWHIQSDSEASADADLTGWMSTVLMTFKEQLQYQADGLAQRWLQSFCSMLANIGDDWALCEFVAGQSIEPSHDCSEDSLFNALWLVVFLGDAEGTYLATADKWILLHDIVRTRNSADLTAVKQWILARWLPVIQQSSEEYLLQQQFLIANFQAEDLTAMPELADFVKAQLMVQAGSLNYASLVPPVMALEWLNELVQAEVPIFQLLTVLDASHPLSGQQLQALFVKFQDNDAALQCLATALRRNAAVQDAKYQFDIKLDASTTCVEATGAVLAELVRIYPTSIPSALEFASKQSPQHVSSLLAALLIYARDAALAILEGHQSYYCRLDLPAVESVEGVCLLALLGHSATVRSSVACKAFETVSTSVLQLQVIVQLQSFSDSANDGKAAAYFGSIISLLTRAFAEDRVEEGKSLSAATLAYIGEFAIAVQSLGADRVISLVDASLLAPLAEAALGNQIQHVSVVQLLAAFAEASKETFPYARSAQTILAHEHALLRFETRVPLVRLLLRMLQISPSCASPAWLDEVLKLHTGTLSEFDTVLFSLLQALESTLRISIGTRVRHWRIEEARPADATELSQGARAKTVEIVFNKQLAFDTLMHFDVCLGTARDAQPVYNLRYAMFMIAGFLYADESMEQLRLLLENHALGLVLLGLAHCDNAVRADAAATLTLFQRLLSTSKLREKLQLETLLRVLQSSMTHDICATDGKPLPLLTAVFLAFSVPVVTMSSGLYLYEKLNRFLLSRPQLDLLDVPMLMTLFFSSGPGATGTGDYGKEIVWLLRMLVAGMADESVLASQSEDEAMPDLNEADDCDQDDDETAPVSLKSNPAASLFLEPYKRRHVIPLVLGLYTARTATVQVKQLVLDLVGRLVDCALYAVRGADRRGGAVRLLKRYGVGVWLTMQHALLHDSETDATSANASLSKRASREGAGASRRRAETQVLLKRIKTLEADVQEVLRIC